MSLNFSLMLEASGAQQAGNPLCDFPRNPSGDGCGDGPRLSQQLLGAVLLGQTDRPGVLSMAPVSLAGALLPLWAIFSALTVPWQMEVLLH